MCRSRRDNRVELSASFDSVPSSTITTIGANILTILEDKEGYYLSPLYKRDLIKSHVVFATLFRLGLYLRNHVRINLSFVRTIEKPEDFVQLVAIAIC